jgi:hypothetical protein
LSAARDNDSLVMAGALADPADGAMLVFKGDSPSVAEEFARNDPYVKNGLITDWWVRAWTVVVERGSKPHGMIGRALPYLAPTMVFLRNLLAVLAGLIVAGVVVFLMEWVGHAIYPPPADLNYADELAMGEYMRGQPTGAFLLVMLAHALGTLAGAAVAALIGRSWQLGLAMIVGFIMMLGGTWNLYRFPHPVWMWIEVPVYLVAAWLGGKWGMRPRGTRSL